MTLSNLIQLFGGVGLFLFAISLISGSLQKMAGERLRGIIGMFTRTPLIGVALGAGVTVLIQSSTATTVMTVSFVETGLMNLTQAIGVIMGANIGTTVTGQILAFKVSEFLYVFIIIGAVFSFFLSSSWFKHLGTGLIGFGLLFLGMQTMGDAMSFLRGRPDLLLPFVGNPLFGVCAGAVLTILIQSSAATVGLAIALGAQGILPLEAAIPVILGDNIGTTLTAVVVALGTGRAARQACAAHVLFNILGVCIFLPLMPFYLNIIAATADGIGHQIANAHTLFNVCNTLIFLPFVTPFAALIRKLVPDGPGTSGDTRYLDPRLLTRTPVAAIGAVRHECRHMGRVLLEMFDRTELLFFNGKVTEREAIASAEDRLDRVDIAIKEYAGKIFQQGLNYEDAAFLTACVNSSGELERIGDKCRRMVDFYDYKKKRGKEFSPEAMDEILRLFHSARGAVEHALNMCSVRRPNQEEIDALLELTENVRREENRLRGNHADRVALGKCTADAGLVFIDVLGAIEQMAYRTRKFAEYMTQSRPEHAHYDEALHSEPPHLGL